MWPFKEKEKKPEEPSIDEVIEAIEVAAQEKVFARYPKGKDFDYMGLTCKVTKHVTYLRGLNIDYIRLEDREPHVECDYIDNSGNIKNVIFSVHELNRL